MRKNRFVGFGMLRQLRRDQSGGAIVETALAVNFLALFLLGAIEFGRVTYASIVVTNAAKAAAQYGAQGTAYCGDSDNTATQNGGIQKAAQNEAGWIYSQNTDTFLTTSSISYICSDDSAATGLNTDCSTSQLERIIAVTSSVTFKPLIHVPGTPSTYTLTGGATQKVMIK